MSRMALLAILVLIVGTGLNVSAAIVLSTVLLLRELVGWLWRRIGLERIGYTRRLERDRVTWGEDIPVAIEVWNRRRVPVAWLQADDDATPGVIVREQPLLVGGGGRVLRNAWSLAPYERVTRRFHVSAERRGVYELGPVGLTVGDLFAREAGSDRRDTVDRFLVRPRIVKAAPPEARDIWGGQDRARTGLTEDPSRFAGIRAYTPGDPIRRVHHRASARIGRPVVKRFEPSRDREVLLALDVQTGAGPAWKMTWDADEVESLFVIAASIARSLAAERAAFGMAAAGYHGAERRFAYVAPSAAPGQLERVLDLLARLSSDPSAPFGALLGKLARTLEPGTSVVILTARDPAIHLGWLRRIERAGCRVVVLACGPDGVLDAERVRRHGIAARSVRLSGPWQTAERVAVTA
jgi:uncharacterized protein (DUF58 family)